MDTLQALSGFSGRPGPVVLAILDGVAYSPYDDGDAFAAASTPTLDMLRSTCPHTRLKAHGKAVGMPSDDDMGNSEVGHNAIGAGRVFAQGATLVANAVNDGSMFSGATWQKFTTNCRDNNSALHFIGLLSDGNVHSHITHIEAMITEAKKAGVKQVRLHALLDGRDVGETSALDYVNRIEAHMASLNDDGFDARIASGGGRMVITMDRYNADWDMVDRGWQTHVRGNGRSFASTTEAIEMFRSEKAGVIDQDLPPFVIADASGPIGKIEDDDAVIMFNFRGDRAIELSIAFEADEFAHFDRGVRPKVLYAGMMQYDGDTHTPANYLVEPPSLDRTMGEYLAKAGKRQLAVSETQKFGHVTYFFNGNRSSKFADDLEDYVEITSDRVSFDERPWMKAAEITDVVIKGLQSKKYDFIRINYPNGDMVGHTGDFQATCISVEATDLCIKRLLPEIKAVGGVLIIAADHGNADEMYERDKQGKIKVENGKKKAKTCHTLNPVPCIIYDPQYNGEYRLSGRTDLGITSLAATSLNLLGYIAPEGYDPSVINFS